MRTLRDRIAMMTDIVPGSADYSGIHGDIVALLEAARRAAAPQRQRADDRHLLGDWPAHR